MIRRGGEVVIIIVMIVLVFDTHLLHRLSTDLEIAGFVLLDLSIQRWCPELVLRAREKDESEEGKI